MPTCKTMNGNIHTTTTYLPTILYDRLAEPKKWLPKYTTSCSVGTISLKKDL